ncbi:MAG: hypothetical protein LBK06_01335 [Planctomycetaceae bacterium]|jgi:hypothetical protein|nr:hypothetical protein [Planctomycetaceae bacterium]
MREILNSYFFVFYTEAGKAIGFALEQPLHVVALPCSALRILKRLQHIMKSCKKIVTIQLMYCVFRHCCCKW